MGVSDKYGLTVRCKHCYDTPDAHTDDKCLYGPMTFEAIVCGNCGGIKEFWFRASPEWVRSFVPLIDETCCPGRTR